MKEILKPALGTFGRQLVVNLMNMFMCMSLMVLATAAFTSVNGYKAFVYQDGNDKPIAEYTYKNSDGEDTKKAEYEDQGYKVVTSETRDDLSKGETTAYYIITQIIGLVLVGSFVYPNMWSLGAKDSNLVRFKHKKEDKLRGLKIGLIAIIPLFIAMVVFLVALREATAVALFAMLFASFFSFIHAIGGSAQYLSDLSVLQSIMMVLPLFIIPLIAWAAYLLGYKDISLGEKLIYKNNNKKK